MQSRLYGAALCAESFPADAEARQRARLLARSRKSDRKITKTDIAPFVVLGWRAVFGRKYLPRNGLHKAVKNVDKEGRCFEI